MSTLRSEDEKVKKFICTATIEIEAKNEDDVQIDLSFKMDANDIDWIIKEIE